MSIDDTRRAYDQFCDREWMRLEGGAQARLEYLVTSHALSTYLPASTQTTRILDAGGGPGRYTIDLAERGYLMTLFDLSPNLLACARGKIEQLDLSVQQNIHAIVEGTISDLGEFADHSFDALLCLGGPISHLTLENDRIRAMNEFRRVVKPGGLLFVSVLGTLGAYRSAVQWFDWFDGCIPVIAETGVAPIGPGRAPACFMTPEEITSLIESNGFSVINMIGCQGIGAHLDEANLLSLMDDPVRWPMWRDLLLATCDHPNIIGISSPIIAVTRST